MITTEEVATRVYQMLLESEVNNMISGQVDYERNDYTKEDVIIVPHTIEGAGSLRFGQIKVNIHVPDLVLKVGNKKSVYRTNFDRLIAIRAKVIEVLKNHYEKGQGYNWAIGALDHPLKEQGQNEHFVSVALELTVRERMFNQ